MDVKGTGFVFRLNSSLQYGRTEFFEKLMTLYHITINILKSFGIKSFSERTHIHDFP